MNKKLLLIFFFLYSHFLLAQTEKINILHFDNLYQELGDSCFMSKMLFDEGRKMIWLDTNKGLYGLKDSLKVFHESEINNIAFSISSFHLANNTLWCGTANGFVFSIDVSNAPNNFITQKYSSLGQLKGKKKIKSQAILSLATDGKYVYAGTTEGLIVSYKINDTTPNGVQTNITNPTSNSDVYDLHTINHNKSKDSYLRAIAGIANGLFYASGRDWIPINIRSTKVGSPQGIQNTKKIKLDFDISTAYKIKENDSRIWAIGKGNKKESNKQSILFSFQNPYDEKSIDMRIYAPNCIKENNQLKFNDFQLDTKGNAWIATENGLIIYNTITDNCQHITSETDSLFTIKQIDNIFLENDSTVYLFGVSSPKKGNEVFKMKIGELPNEEKVKDTLTNEVQVLGKIEDIECNKLLKLENLVFGSSQDNFVNYSLAKKDLNLLVTYLIQNPNKKVEIEAHTSVVTNEDKEKEISEKRLKKVTDYLIEHGVSKKQIETFAKGDKELLIKEPKTSTEHQQNRRVIAKITCA